MSRTQVLVDERGRGIGAPDGTTIGMTGTPRGMRMRWALSTNAPGGGPSARYSPPWAPGEDATIAIDLSLVIPSLVGIASATLTATPPDHIIAQVTFSGRHVYATMSGGVSGTDYQLKWVVTDTQGDIYPRTMLLLCSPTS